MWAHSSLQPLKVAQIYSLKYVFGTLTPFMKCAHLFSNQTTLQYKFLPVIFGIGQSRSAAYWAFIAASSPFDSFDRIVQLCTLQDWIAFVLIIIQSAYQI